MVSVEDYGDFETAWCPGCGNFSILEALKKALADEGLAPQQVLMVSGIGQAAKAPHYLRANVFNGLHGRALPTATGAKLANPELTVIVESGDGCTYGEGGNHFLAGLRRNIDVTYLAHDNQIYGPDQGPGQPDHGRGLQNQGPAVRGHEHSLQPRGRGRGHEGRVRGPGLFRPGGPFGGPHPSGHGP